MKVAKPFRFRFGIDPLRLLLALGDHRLLLVLMTLTGLIAGSYLGHKLFKEPSFEVTAVLEKTREAEGQSILKTEYPQQLLRDETLQAMCLSAEILLDVKLELNLPDTLRDLQNRLKVSYDTRRRQFFLTARAPDRAQAADLVNIWASKIDQKTKSQQREYAQTYCDSLKDNVTSLEEELKPLDEAIQKLASEQKIVDDAVNYQALLTRRDDLRAEFLRLKRDDLTWEERYKGAVQALLERHPLQVQVDKAEYELIQLRAEYTDAHELVIKKREFVASLVRQYADYLRQVGPEPTETQLLECSKTEGAATLWIEYKKLKDEKASIHEGLILTQQEIDDINSTLEELPAISNQFKQLNRQREQLSAKLNELQNMYQSAAFFTDHPTGYLRVFEKGVSGLAKQITGTLETLALSLGLGGLGLGLAFLFAMIAELRKPQLRTMLQGAITTRSIPRFWLMQNDEIEDEANIREFWLTHLARREDGGRRILFPVVGDLKAEFTFWRELLHSIKRDDAMVLFIDVSQEPIPDSFLQANLLPFTPPQEPMMKSSGFLGTGAGAHELWGKSEDTSLTAPSRSELLTGGFGSSQHESALTPLRMTNDQPLIPYGAHVSQSARYVSAADYSTEQLARLLKDLPPHYYVLCRWAIGPTASLAAIAKHFDQHYFLNTPSSTSRKSAASQSRIFRRILDQSNGIVFLNEPTEKRVLRFVNWLHIRYFSYLNRGQAGEGLPSTKKEDDHLA